MADPTQVTAAQDDAKAQQAALLAAIAEQGSRGAALYGQAAQQAQADRATALQSAVQRAQGQGGPGAAGAPAALTSQLSAQAVQPADARAADVAQAQTAFNQDQASLTSANDNYMSQLAAAVPVVQSRTDATVAQLQAQAAQAAQQRALQLQLGQLQLQQEQAALENTKASGDNIRAQNGRDSVAQQKLDASDAEKKRQNDVFTFAQAGGGPTFNAFSHLLTTAGPNGKPATSPQEVYNALNEATHPTYSYWGHEDLLPIALDFPGVDINQLTDLINTYFGVGSPAAPDASSGALSQHGLR